ncbi:MAG: DUF3300 domain-containing protein [Gammaproteobacteria bacterium]|nr:MAG: DUF3300 domain-containing protein [Gammaproteobacteria bacterium]
MRKLLAIFGYTIFAILLCAPIGASQAEDKTFSEAELDQMMAPIALYPDALLSQILMASTYPADIAEAVKWSKEHPDQEGDAAVNSVQEKSWDPSVMSLVAFPQVLTMMGEQADWVQNVGDAFLANSEGVMDTVQKLRKKAKDEGNLETTEQQKVVVEEQASETIIIIEPADPEVVYVPVYNTTVVYGTWWWPHYRPWYYYPPGYGFGSAVMRGIGFGVGIGITHALWGGCHWGRGHGSVNINVNKYNNINANRNKINANNRNSNWKHNASNRRGVPYRDNKSRQQYGNKRAGADQRQNYRGRDAQRDKARSTLDKRAVDPTAGRKQLQGSGGDKARSSVNKANRQTAQNRQNRGNNYSSGSRKSHNNALKGAGNAQKSRQNVNRGTRSNRSMNNRSSGHRSGGARRSGGGGRRR